MFHRGVGVHRMVVPLRLSQTSASRKHIALEFIKRTIAEFGRGHSFRELSAVLSGASLSRVNSIVRKLEAEGQIVVRPGARGISLPEPADNLSASDIVRRARALGFHIILNDAFGGTHSALPMPPMLDHIPDVEIGGNDDDEFRETG